jgi:SAM-dependent methyltransferase
VLEHVEDPVSVFEELRRVLRPTGHLIFRVPSRFHYVSVAARLTPLRFHRWFNAQRGFGAENFPTFYRINDRSALRNLAGATGYVIRDLDLFEIKPSYLVFHPLAYRVGIGYERLVNRFDLLQGLRSNIIGVFEAV